MQIYWIKNNERCGPATVPDVMAKIQLGELSPETRGWHAGCAEWVPLRELPALADFLNREKQEKTAETQEDAPQESQEPQEPTEAAQADSAAKMLRIIIPSPALRLMARLVDMSLYAALAMSVIYMLRVPYNPMFMPTHPVFWLPMIVLEALVLCLWRTTPGKYWMGIRLHSIRNHATFFSFLVRSILVFSLGMGCMIPLISIVTLVMAYFGITQRGVALWDLPSGTIPMLTTPPTRARFFLVIIFILLSINLCSHCLQPWLPDVLNEMRETAPAAVEFLEQYMPPHQ